MSFIDPPKQVDEIPLRILQEPEEKLRETEELPPKITDNGKIQQDLPQLHVVASPAWFMTKATKAPETGIIGTEVIKGERALSGYTNYWLIENGSVVKSIIALTDSEANRLLS